MFLLGSNFCGDDLAMSPSPAAVNNINYVELKNGIYDDLYISRNADFTLTGKCPPEWDFDTVLYAKFNYNTNAGNVDWNLSTVSHLLIKKRLEQEFKWQTLVAKPIQDLKDFVINYNDYTNASGAVYEYALVPVLYSTEGSYSTTLVESDFQGMFLIESDMSYHTHISDLFCDTTRNIPSSTVELLNSRYPVYVRNTIANYDTGSCRGVFVPVEEDGCTIDYEADYKRVSYQKNIMNILSDGVPKILKLGDGRIWLVQITPSPTDQADQIYKNRNINFSWVEIGDINSEEDLYLLGLSNISEEWWNS